MTRALALLVVVACAAPRPTPAALTLTAQNALTVPVRIGHHDLVFMVDTGATDTTISRDTWLKLGLPRGEASTAHGASSVEQSSEIVTVKSLRVGGREVNNLRVMVIDRLFPSDGRAQIDGLLGQDVLARYVVDADIPKRTLILHDKDSTAWRTPNLVAVDYTHIMDVLIELRGEIDGVLCDVLLDLGAGVSIANSKAAPNATADAKAKGIGSDGLPLAFAIANDRDVTIRGNIDDVEFPRSRLHVADLPAFAAIGFDGPALVLGIDLLAKRRVVIDPTAKRVYFTP